MRSLKIDITFLTRGLPDLTVEEILAEFTDKGLTFDGSIDKILGCEWHIEGKLTVYKNEENEGTFS